MNKKKIDFSVPDFTPEQLRSLIVKAEGGDKLSEKLLLPLMERYWAPKIIELLEDRFVYGAFGLENSEINTGSDNDEVEIKITSSNNDAFTSYAVKSSSIKLGEGNDNLNITQSNSSGNLDIAISGEVSYSVLYDFGAGDDIGSFSSDGYGIKSDGNDKHRVVLGDGNDSFTISSVYSAFYKSNLFADEGDDAIDLRASNQFHYGIEDSDIYLGDGDDYLTLDSSKNSNIDGGEGSDIIKILDSSENYNIENLQSNNFEITSAIDGFFKLNLSDVEQISFDDKNISLLAEFDNYKRRLSKQMADSSKYEGKDAFIKILPIIDDIDRVLMNNNSDVKSIIEGIDLIKNKFISVLDELGINSYNSIERTFNPDYHEAIMIKKTKKKSNLVIE